MVCYEYAGNTGVDVYDDDMIMVMMIMIMMRMMMMVMVVWGRLWWRW